MTALYPDTLDGETNLYVAHDSLRVTLVEDYLPGQTIINIIGDTTEFPTSGLLTLTEQQGDIQDRAISFFYASKTDTTFNGLELLPGFTDVAKPKSITHVTQNVMAQHHNNLKDAIIAIEDFVGIKGVVDLKPLGETVEGRTNFLRKLVLKPRAWFTANKRIGIRPLTVKFNDLSFRSPANWCWNFGDGTGNTLCSISGLSTPSSTIGVSSLGDSTITKTYFDAGVYDVSLAVSNEFGEDIITIPKYITVRVSAPDEATLDFVPDTNTQTYIDGVLTTRSSALISVFVDDNGQQTGDPVTNYTWDMQDDLTHIDASAATASYTIGGLYDIRLKVNTTLGAYRTTIFTNKINVIEKTNLFLMISPNTSNAVTKNFYSQEFGLISETFKTLTRNPVSITRNYTIVGSQIDSARAIKEFLSNNGFCNKNEITSGNKGAGVLYWTEGGSPIKVRFKEYTGFTDMWNDPPGSFTTFNRGWNWTSLNTIGKIYFLFGSNTTISPSTPGISPTNQTKDVLSLTTYTISSSTLDSNNYKNGADELMQNVGLGNHGDFSVYRTCWKDHTGYIIRNDGVGSYFRLKSFYRTEGTLTQEIQYIRKLPDMPGSTKLEGQLVPMSNGVYFFNNSGEIVAWNDTTNVWAIGQPSATSTPFRLLQDQTVSGFDDQTNTLKVVSDGNNMAYLDFDYSDKCFMKFNQTSLVFTSLISRPAGEQLLMGAY